MKKVVSVLFLCALIASPARAGWDEAVEAYAREDYATAHREYRPLAMDGDVSAQNMLGWLYSRGLGVPKNRDEATRWYGKALRQYRIAAAQGDIDSQFRIGLAYEAGRGVAVDYAEALKWYGLAAGRGHVRAQTSLGSMHGYGQGVPRNYREQIKWYTMAARQGDIWAQSNLAHIYLLGAGKAGIDGDFVPQSYARAAKWFLMAAEQGDDRAQEYLGQLYSSGRGVVQDYAAAAKWYLRAAEQGNSAAQEEIGGMYVDGRGVPGKLSEGYKWLNLAAIEGSERVRRKRDAVAAKMTPAEISRSQRRSRQWLAVRKAFTALEKAASRGSGKSRLALAKRYVARGLTPETENQAAGLLRRIVADKQEDYLLPALSLMGEIRQSLRIAFSAVSDAAIEATRGSVGIALSRTGDTKTGIAVTLREALLLHHIAQIHLEVVYRYPVDGYQPYDPRILQYFRKTAAEKLPRSMFFLGRILLNGWGVDADVRRAKYLLKTSGLGDAYMVLATHALAQKNIREMEVNLEKAAVLHIPKAHFNLGVLAGNRGSFKTAVRHYRRTLELDPDYHEASLNLAQIYSGEFGITGQERRAFEIMKKLADGAEGPVSARAKFNLGFFYLNGTGVKQSTDLAKKYLKKAADSGIEQARQKLREIQ